MCDKEALIPGKGVIYVRAEIKGKWGNHIICLPCYKIHYRPDRDKKMPKNMDMKIKDFSHHDFIKWKDGLIKEGLVTENPPEDLHLTTKGREIARLLAMHQWNKITLELSTQQKYILEALHHYD